jgi:hypothetical protein
MSKMNELTNTTPSSEGLWYLFTKSNFFIEMMNIYVKYFGTKNKFNLA